MQNKINQIINQYKDNFRNLLPILTYIANYVNIIIDSNFAEQGRWDGKGTDLFSGGSHKWKPLAESTKKSYKKKGYILAPTLLRRHGLRQSIQVSPKGKTGISISANQEYAAIHQFGGQINIPPKQSTRKIKRKDGSYLERKVATKGGTINIPARPYLTLTPKDLEEIINILSKHLMEV